MLERGGDGACLAGHLAPGTRGSKAALPHHHSRAEGRTGAVCRVRCGCIPQRPGLVAGSATSAYSVHRRPLAGAAAARSRPAQLFAGPRQAWTADRYSGIGASPVTTLVSVALLCLMFQFLFCIWVGGVTHGAARDASSGEEIPGSRQNLKTKV